MTLDEFVAALMDCGANGDTEVLLWNDEWLTPVGLYYEHGLVTIELELN